MIVRELYRARTDGVRLYRTYSDGGYRIRQEQTGAVYDEAIDVESAAYTYAETSELIPAPPAAEDMTAPEEIERAMAEGGEQRMTKDEALENVRAMARICAGQVQEKAGAMTGAELYAEKTYIPEFAAAKEAKNMLEREAGFVCRSSAGRVVRLLQPYDSTVYPDEPETLPAQWGFKWSTEPGDALPFISLATSPYGVGDCCTEGGKIWRSKIAGNVYAPSAYPAGWKRCVVHGIVRDRRF